MAVRTIPTISSLPELAQWRHALKNSIKSVAAPMIPWNFQVTSKQGGNFLTWTSVKGADGYEVDVSTTGDFSTNITTIPLRSSVQTSYFDSVPTAQGGAPATRWYQVRATSGTVSQPHSVKGLNSGVISSNAIAPNDTTTASTTGSDGTTNDGGQSRTRGGRYFQFQDSGL
jgi:hypothetical protein